MEVIVIYRGEKERLNNEAERKYLFLRLFTGLKSIFSDRTKTLIVSGYLMFASIMWQFKGIFFSTQTENIFSKINNLSILLALPILIVIGLLFLLVLFGTPYGSKSVRDNLWRIGLTNHAGEAPLLITRHSDSKDRRLSIMEFVTNGIPLSEWEDKKAKIETALNVHVIKVTEGANKRRIMLYTVPVKDGLPDVANWKDTYMSDEDFVLILGEDLLGKHMVNLALIPHILIGGATGSGKSVLLKLLILQCIKKDAVVSIADFKGGVDFPAVWHRHCRIVIEENELLDLLEVIIEELMRRREVFKEYGCANISEYNKKIGEGLKRFVFVCDEVAEILDKTGLDKSKKELVSAIESKLSTIARLGRAFGIHLILATQRPDANVLSGQIKNNVNYRICGRADHVLSQIILDNTSASDQIPKDAQGRFITHDGTVFQGYWFDESKAFD